MSLAPRGMAPARRREIAWLLIALSVAGILTATGATIRAAEQERRQAAVRSLTARVATSAALTDSLFKALGASSAAQLAQQYGGAHLAAALRTDARRNRRLNLPTPLFLAITDGTGRSLASVGPAPERFAIAAGAPEQARLSGVLPAGTRQAIQFVVPFRTPDGAYRSLVRGVRVYVMRAFLADFLARLPNPEGARLTLTDAGTGGVLLAQRDALVTDDQGPEAITTASSRVPGTPWRLTLAAPSSRVFAGADTHRLVPWLLLTALGAAALSGMGLARRLELVARRERRASSQLAASREELRSLISALDEGVAHRDVDGRIHLLNDSARRHLDTERDVIENDETPWRLLDVNGEPLAHDAQPGRHAAQGDAVTGTVIGLQDSRGDRRWLRFSAQPLKAAGASAPHPVVMSFTDVTPERELQLHLTRMAERDPLTDLTNRRRFEVDLATQLARCRRYGEKSALVLLDIDQFKAINDSLGHLAGDEVLRTIARTVQARLRAGDVAARLGGDEFALLLVDAGEADARAIAAELGDRIRVAVRSSLEELDVRVTFGVAVLDAERGSADEALDASDRDMYANKPRRGTQPPPHGVADPAAEEDDRPQALSALLAAVRARDAYTAAHSQDVVALARAVGARLELDRAARLHLEHVALIHDIGKIAIPDAILHKPSRLNPSELAMMRRHSEVGAQIVGAVEVLAHLAPAVRAEHEHWDGSGYPDGLAGDEIPLASRIVLVCDAYHAMTTDRPYRSAIPAEDAIAEIKAHAGTQFCPSATAALLDLLRARQHAAAGAAGDLAADTARGPSTGSGAS